jgi:hypothetical protein
VSLLNYTTKIKAEKTAGEVTRILVRGGARQIMNEFDAGGNASGVSFSITTPDGIRGFTLPINYKPVEKILAADPVASRFGGNEKETHARNVAWRIVKDWLEAQMALIETNMVTFEQVMLPYMRAVDGGTFYEAYLHGEGTKALTQGEGTTK